MPAARAEQQDAVRSSSCSAARPAADRGRSSEGQGRLPTAVLLALGAADVAFAFQQTAIIPAIPTIKHELHVSSAWSAWLLSGYLIASSIATPLLGKLADRYGERRLLIISLLLFLVGSLGASLAPSIGILIGSRSLQGAGGAVFPLSLSIARARLAKDQVRIGVGLLTGAFGIGTTLGVALSGAIIELASWRWIFGVGAIGIALALALLPFAVPRSEGHAEVGLSPWGGLLLTGGITLILVALTEGGPLGWSNWRTIAMFAAGLAALAGWVWHDLHAEKPLIDLRVLGRRAILLTNAASLLLGYTLFGLYFLIPMFVSSPRSGYGFGAGPLDTGLFLLPAAVGQLVGGSTSGFVADRFGAKWVFTAGMALSGAAGVWLGLAHGSAGEVLGAMVVLGLGNGLAIGTASALITETAPGGETGIATALNSLLRRTGGGLGAQISAALLAGLTLSGGGPAQQGFVIAFWLCAGAGLLGAGLAVGTD